MTVLERRVRMATAILNDLNDHDFSEIEKTYNQIVKKTERRSSQEPCMYTIDEIRASLPEREKALADGKGISHEEVMKEYGL